MHSAVVAVEVAAVQDSPVALEARVAAEEVVVEEHVVVTLYTALIVLMEPVGPPQHREVREGAEEPVLEAARAVRAVRAAEAAARFRSLPTAL